MRVPRLAWGFLGGGASAFGLLRLLASGAPLAAFLAGLSAAFSVVRVSDLVDGLMAGGLTHLPVSLNTGIMILPYWLCL